MIDPEEPWWHEYDPDPIPGAYTLLGQIVGCIIAPFVFAAIAITALRARWRR